jgi:hypothetical protein
MIKKLRRMTCALALAALPLAAQAKPIAFAHGTTVMAEYGAGTMTELQAFYAPSYRYSFGGGHLALDGELDDRTRDITYLRVNYLPKRWNLPSAQANVFVWGGIGRASAGDDGSDLTTWNAGGQIDYETRRVYASLRTDHHESSAFSHRIDTLQLGLAAYPHETNGLAVWFVVQAREMTGGLTDGTEVAALLRLFRRNAWVEAGLTQDGKLQAMVMFNF